MSNSSVVDFSIGGILQRGVEVLSQNFATFGTLSALFMLLPFVSGVAMGNHFEVDGTVSVFAIGSLAMLWVMLYFLLFATLTHATICYLRGTPARISESLSWALGVLFPVIGITIIATIGTGLGVILLLIPGLVLMTMWWVAVPAAVVEQTGIIESLRRSGELTRGYRWKVFGVIIFIYIGQFALDRLTNVVLAAAPIFSLVVNFLVMAAITAYFAVVTAVCYHDLRAIKDGVGIQDIAQVFD